MNYGIFFRTLHLVLHFLKLDFLLRSDCSHKNPRPFSLESSALQNFFKNEQQSVAKLEQLFFQDTGIGMSLFGRANVEAHLKEQQNNSCHFFLRLILLRLNCFFDVKLF